MTLLDAQHVSKAFGKVRVLDDVSLVVEAGTVHALLGENGSGKSTLIKVLAGFHAPEPGAIVTVEGTDLSLGSPSDSTSAGLRFVHQNLGVIDQMTVLENLRLTSDLQRGALAPIGFTSDRDVRPLLDRIGVQLDLNAVVGSLEPVQRTAVAIARAIDDSHGQMRLLVLDEPTAAMSPTEVDGLFAIIRELRSSGASVLYISHRIDEILRLADTATVLRDGRVQGCFAATSVSRTDLVAHIVGVTAEDSVTSGRVAEDVAQSNVCLDVTRVHGRYLRDVSFRVRRGEILGFAGLDGSGRDELALALGGAAEADVDLRTEAGAISGRSSVVQTRAAGIGLVLPNTHPGAMVAEFTVRENLCLPNASSMSRRGLISERGERKAARRWLEELDIRPRESEKLLREFSGGNRQKVALAKVLQQNPSVLVLNDPTSGVDVGARRSIYDVIEQRASLGVGIVVCSSDIEDLVSVCDRVLCLVAGAIVDELTGEQLTEHAVLNRIVSDGSESGRSAKPDVAPRHRSGDDAVASWRSIA